MKKVSIIMGIYNCEKTLDEAIQSILDQTYENWELIMCDDASRDQTYEIALKYAKQYPDNVILIKNNVNMRLAKTLNHCLKYATGDYIARMDGDDVSEPKRIEKQVQFLEQHAEYDLVGTLMISFDENGEQGIRKVEREPKVEDIVYGNPFCHATVLARKKVYDSLGGYSEASYISRCEDVELWFRFFEKGFRGYNLQEPLYRVRETLGDFKRRKLKYTFDTMRVCFEGYNRLRFPVYKYIYILKPLISDLLPRRFIKYYHNRMDGKNKK